MRYLASYLLLKQSGVNNIRDTDIKELLGSVGIDVDEQKLSKVLSELTDKDIDELIKLGSAKLASVPSGGSVSSTNQVTVEIKEESKVVEETKEESDDDMGFGLFD